MIENVRFAVVRMEVDVAQIELEQLVNRVITDDAGKGGVRSDQLPLARCLKNADRGEVENVAVFLFRVEQCLLGLPALCDVVNDRVEILTSADFHRTGVNLDIANCARRQPVLHLVVTVPPFGDVRHFVANARLVKGDADIPDFHRAQPLDAPAVVLGRSHVRVDDDSGFGIEDELNGAIVLEHLSVAAFVFAQRCFLTLLFDGRCDLLRHEHQNLFVARREALRRFVRLNADDAPRAIAGFQRRTEPIHRPMANELDLSVRAQALEYIRRRQQRLACAQNECCASAAGRLAFRSRIELIDEVRIVDDAAFRVVLRDVEVRRLHQRADHFVNLPIEFL